jgi:hypothetical protein
MIQKSLVHVFLSHIHFFALGTSLKHWRDVEFMGNGPCLFLADSTPPFPMPAQPHNGNGDGVAAAHISSIFTTTMGASIMTSLQTITEPISDHAQPQ